MVCGVWCVVYGVWCVVYGVWCVVCRLWGWDWALETMGCDGMRWDAAGCGQIQLGAVGCDWVQGWKRHRKFVFRVGGGFGSEWSLPQEHDER